MLEKSAKPVECRANTMTTIKPEGWPDKCRNCGADWTHLSYDNADGFSCDSCGGSDSDEVYGDWRDEARATGGHFG